MNPHAIANAIHSGNARDVRAQMIVEGANGPVSVRGDRILAQRDIPVVPDILANGGGVVSSYFEWVQGLQHFFWTESEVNDRLIALMQRAFRDVLSRAEREGGDLRGAALARGIGRVHEAKRRRGVFP